ncbi:MAG TPA: DmsC/YnfH family molybdoenzyme membrane anchor subunit [Ramlibacter sp.]
MKPALSIILFTTLAGVGQGLVVMLAVASLMGLGVNLALLWVAAVLLALSLVASFFHLGHPLRAWRAALMWRTSWMSREVIVLPAFIALTVAWALFGGAGAAFPLAAIVLALVLWYCTAMIYACIRFIQEWAHPLTIVNYTMLGLSSGAVLFCALAAASGASEIAFAALPWALVLTVLAWIARAQALRRNARLKPRSTTQSATGIDAARVVQRSMGFTGGSFNTREFFHGATLATMRNARVGFQVLAFALPIVLLAWAWLAGSSGALILAVPVQFAGLLAERWVFFAQARHPQNIYYQVVS